MVEPGFFASLPLISGAREALIEMSKLPGVHLMFCTSPLVKYHMKSLTLC